MAGVINDAWTTCTTYLEMIFDKTLLSNGSGFYWCKDECWYLVTNWHNLSGLNPDTGKPLDSIRGAVPNRVRTRLYLPSGEPDDQGLVTLHWVPMIMELNDAAGEPKWFEHPVHGRKVDVAVLPMPTAFKSTDFMVRTPLEIEGDAVLQPTVGQDVFVLGYPIGLVTGLPIPLWKGGYIASEPTMEPNGLPLLFIDAATRPGMSGSLVISKHLIFGGFNKKDGTRSNTLYALRYKVLGVYSGRLDPSTVAETQIGRVWKSDVIDEIIEGKRRAHL
jgi:hypothetical protein